MRRVRLTAWPLALCLLLAPPLHAEEEPATETPCAAAAAAWAWLQAVDSWRTAVLQRGRILREAAATPDLEERAQVATLDTLRVGSKLRDEAEAAFRRAFEATPFEAWSPDSTEHAEHAAIVRAGLDLAARHALEEDPAAAIRWWDRLIEAFPDSPDALRARTTWLPIALLSQDDAALARERLVRLHEEAEAEWQPELEVALGDEAALRGDYAVARALYAAARAAIPEDADRNDPRGRLRGHLELRLRLVGTPAPEIESETWFGREPAPLSSFRGRVVLLDFQATWCGPCLESLPHLQALQDELGERGLSVIALTREYPRKGVLPERPGRARELYRGTTRAEYVAHLEAFRERVGMTVPLVLVEREVAEDYPVRGLPTMLVLDREGTIGFVAVGGKRHHLLRRAVESRLAP